MLIKMRVKRLYRDHIQTSFKRPKSWGLEQREREGKEGNVSKFFQAVSFVQVKSSVSKSKFQGKLMADEAFGRVLETRREKAF